MEQAYDFQSAVDEVNRKLGDAAIMQLASSVDDDVAIRTISAIMYDDKIYFKTDINFGKMKELEANPRVAMCKSGVNLKGIVKNTGLVVDEPGRKFEKLYTEHHDGSYNAYSHEDSEVLLEVTPKTLQIWDVDEDNHAYQIFVNYDEKTAVKKIYDEKK